MLTVKAPGVRADAAKLLAVAVVTVAPLLWVAAVVLLAPRSTVNVRSPTVTCAVGLVATVIVAVGLEATVIVAVLEVLPGSVSVITSPTA